MSGVSKAETTTARQRPSLDVTPMICWFVSSIQRLILMGRIMGRTLYQLPYLKRPKVFLVVPLINLVPLARICLHKEGSFFSLSNLEISRAAAHSWQLQTFSLLAGGNQNCVQVYIGPSKVNIYKNWIRAVWSSQEHILSSATWRSYLWNHTLSWRGSYQR